MVTASVIGGRADRRAIVWGPEPAMLKLMTSSPGVLFASAIACRSEPGPAALPLSPLPLGRVRVRAGHLRARRRPEAYASGLLDLPMIPAYAVPSRTTFSSSIPLLPRVSSMGGVFLVIVSALTTHFCTS